MLGGQIKHSSVAVCIVIKQTTNGQYGAGSDQSIWDHIHKEKYLNTGWCHIDVKFLNMKILHIHPYNRNQATNKQKVNSVSHEFLTNT